MRSAEQGPSIGTSWVPATISTLPILGGSQQLLTGSGSSPVDYCSHLLLPKPPTSTNRTSRATSKVSGQHKFNPSYPGYLLGVVTWIVLLVVSPTGRFTAPKSHSVLTIVLPADAEFVLARCCHTLDA